MTLDALERVMIGFDHPYLNETIADEISRR